MVWTDPTAGAAAAVVGFFGVQSPVLSLRRRRTDRTEILLSQKRMAEAGAVYSGHPSISRKPAGRKGKNPKSRQDCKEEAAMKKSAAVIMAMVMAAVLGLSACGGEQGASAGTAESGTKAPQEAARQESPAQAEQETAAEQNTAAGQENGQETTEAAGEDADNTAILVVSFGTSFEDSREKTIGAVEKAVAAAYPQFEVRRAFTSQIIIDILKERDSIQVDNVTTALERAAADGVKNLIVQPTHLMGGFEYGDVLREVQEYEDSFDKIVVGDPLLSGEEDFKALAKAITEDTSSYDDGQTAIVFMGHGTEAESNEVYGKLQETLAEEGFENYYIGTVEAQPSLEDISAALKEHGGYKKVVLKPLMLVAGDHANNDMAGDEEDSWKMVLGSEGYEVECVIHGLGELEAVQQLYVEHAGKAAESLR